MLSKPVMRGLLTVLLALMLDAGLASASYISITTRVGAVTLDGGSGSLAVVLSNLGDEPAHGVSISLILPDGFQGSEGYIGRLDPNQEAKKSLEITSPEGLKRGVYPGALIVGYKDANLYPFSAITPVEIINGEPTGSSLIGSLEGLTLKGDKGDKLTLNLKNPDEAVRQIEVRLYAPREFNVKDDRQMFTIEAGGERRIEFEVSSFSALPGSTYQVFVSTAYYANGLAYTSFNKGTIKVEGDEPVLGNRLLLVGLLVLVGIFLVLQLRGRKNP